MAVNVKLPEGKFRGYEQNHLATLPPDDELTRVGPDTPCGEYLRRFWLPVAMTSMVTDLPLRVRRLGEDLVLFRDKSGDYGLLHLHCSHRNASLEFGIIEEKGIRCCYHGWLYDVDGTLLDTPGEPPESKRKENVCQGAYPVIEHNGMVFAYFGPPDKMPPFPVFDTFDLPNDDMVPFLIPSPANWLQVMENSFDPYHTVFLHSRVTGAQFIDAFALLPVIEIFEREYGSFYTNARRVDDYVWIRIHDHMLPSFSQNGGMFPEPDHSRYFGRCGLTRWVVPVDDTNTITIAWRHFIEGDDPNCIGDKELCGYNTVDFYGQTDQRSYEERQRNPGDYDAWTGMGPVSIHAREKLAHTDRGVSLVRRNLRKAIRELKDGVEPQQPTSLGNVVPTFGGDTILRIPPDEADDKELVRQVCHKVAEIYMAGDDYQGQERVDFIQRRLKETEESYA